jgi:phage gp36-like protein
MSDYFTLSDLEALIPSAFLIQALDDDNDGVIDAFVVVQTQAQGEVDAYLEPRFAVPLSGQIPRLVAKAAVTLAAELCYRRRGTPDDSNPWVTQGKAMRSILTKIGQGDLQLQAIPQRDEPLPAGSIETWESGLGAPGKLLG